MDEHLFRSSSDEEDNSPAGADQDNSSSSDQNDNSSSSSSGEDDDDDSTSSSSGDSGGGENKSSGKQNRPVALETSTKPTDPLILGLWEALENSEKHLTIKMFNKMQEMTSATAEWSSCVNQLLNFPLNRKVNLLKLISEDKSCDNKDVADVNNTIIKTLALPSIGRFLNTHGEKHDSDSIALLEALLKKIRDQSTKKRKTDQLRESKNMSSDKYDIAVAHYEHIKQHFNQMVEVGQLASIKTFVGKNSGIWYPFSGPVAVFRFMELDISAKPLNKNYGDFTASSKQFIRRDVSVNDGHEIETILTAISEECAKLMLNDTNACRGFKPRKGVPTQVVDEAVTNLMGKDKLRKKIVWRDGNPFDLPNVGHDSKNVIPKSYARCKLVGSENLEDYDPNSEPKFWSEHAMEKDLDLVAQSYAATKYVNVLNDVGIPVDFVFPAGRDAREAFGLDPVRTSGVVRMECSSVFLVSTRGAKEIEAEKKKDRGTLVFDKNKKNKIPRKVTERIHVIAPVVTQKKNFVTDDFRKAQVDYQNKQPWIVDTSSKGQRRTLRCPFDLNKGKDPPIKGPLHPEVPQMPVIPLGANRAILATEADPDVDPFLFTLANHLVNIPINAINHVKAQMLEKTTTPSNVPKPEISIPAEKFYEYMEKVKEYNPNFFTKNEDGVHEFNPVPDEQLYWGNSGTDSATSASTETVAEENIMDNNTDETLEGENTAAHFDSGSGAPIHATATSAEEETRTDDNTDEDLRTDNSNDDGLGDGTGAAIHRIDGACADSFFVQNQDQRLQINNASGDCGSYKYHQDADGKRGGMLVSEPGRPDRIESVGDQGALNLPSRKRMIVHTQIYGDDNMLAETAIDWRVNNDFLGGVITGRNHAHTQGMGVQYFKYKHGAEKVFNKSATFRGARLAMTFRSVPDPNRDPLTYLCGACHDDVLPVQIEKRSGLTFLDHPTVTNPISDRRPLPPNMQTPKTKPENRCYKAWPAACKFESHKYMDTDVELLPANSDSLDREPFKVTGRQTLMSPSESMMAFFQRKIIPLRDTGGQSASGFLKTPHESSDDSGSETTQDASDVSITTTNATPPCNPPATITPDSRMHTAAERRTLTHTLEDVPNKRRKLDFVSDQGCLEGTNNLGPTQPIGPTVTNTVNCHSVTLGSKTKPTLFGEHDNGPVDTSTTAAVPPPADGNQTTNPTASNTAQTLGAGAPPAPVVGCLKMLRSVQLPNKVFEVAYHHITVGVALQEGKIIDVEGEDGSTKLETLFTQQGKPLAGGTELQIGQIPVEQTTSNHKPTDKRNPHVFVASQKYKQIDMPILEKHKKTQQKITESCGEDFEGMGSPGNTAWNNRVEEIYQKFWQDWMELHSNPLPATGTGGSTQTGGARAPMLSQLRTDRGHFTVGTGQNARDETNEILVQNCESQRVVGMIVNNITMYEYSKEETQDPTKPDAFFIGYYKSTENERRKDSLAKLGKTQPISYLSSQLQNYTFRLFGRQTHYYEPAFPFRTEIELRMKLKHDKSFEYRRIKVSQADKRTIKCDTLSVQTLLSEQALFIKHATQQQQSESEIIKAHSQKFASLPLPIDWSRGYVDTIEGVAAVRAHVDHFDLSPDRPDQFPSELVSQEAILTVLVKKGDFLERHLAWNEEAQQKSESCHYRITTRQVLNTSLAESATNAIRISDPSCCRVPVDDFFRQIGLTPVEGDTYKDKPKSNLAFAVPIHNDQKYNGFANKLPMLRYKPSPTARDLDVSTNCIMNELEVTAQHLKSLSVEQGGGKRFDPDLPGNDLRTLDLPGGKRGTNPVPFGNGHDCSKINFEEMRNLRFFMTIAWKCVLFRCTGNSNTLDTFVEWKQHQGTGKTWRTPPTWSLEQILPMNDTESLQEWCLFIKEQLNGSLDDVGMSHFVSRQHDGFIPEKLRTSACSMLFFFHRLLPEFQIAEDALGEAGDGIVAGELRTLLQQNFNNRNRMNLLHAFVSAISKAGSFQHERILFQLAHQIVLDLETFFIDFAGRVTTDNIFAGHGGKEGLSLIDFEPEEGASEERKKYLIRLNKNRAQEAVEELRLQELHNRVKDVMESKPIVRAVFNAVMDTEGVLRNREWGRGYSVSDTEHKQCCKIYVMCSMVDVGRTVSKAPQCYTNYTGPRANPKEWDEKLRKVSKHIVDAYVSLPEQYKEIPNHLAHPDGARHLTDEEFRHYLALARDGQYSDDASEEEDSFLDEIDNALNPEDYEDP